MVLLPLALCLALQGAPPAPEASAPPADAVVLVAGRPYSAGQLEAWLLFERGEVLAPFYTRYFLARRAADAAGLHLSRSAIREAVEAEVFERLRGAFDGDHDRWAAELATAGRSPTGRMAERAIELEATLLVTELARRNEVSAEELEASWLEGLEIVVDPAIKALGNPAPEDVVLRVGDAGITRADYGRWLRLYRGEIEARRFGESCVLLEAARREEIEVTEAEIDARVRADTEAFVDSFYGGDWDMWRRKLGEERRTEEEHYRLARTPTRRALLLERMVANRRTVSEANVRSLWQERYGSAGELLRLRWMYVRAEAPAPDPDATEDERARRRAAALRAARARATDLRTRIVEGGQDFTTLAERHADDPHAAWPTELRPDGIPSTSLPAALSAALAPLTPGEVSEPVQADDGWYLLELLGRERFALDDVRSALTRELAERPASAIEAQRMQFELVQDLAIEVLPRMFE